MMLFKVCWRKIEIMVTYILLLRGINVGGKNKVPMVELKLCLQNLGFMNASTYIASGNVILQSDKSPNEIKTIVENALPKVFALDSELVKVLVLTHAQLQTVINTKPVGFGDQPDVYHSDVIFLIDATVAVAMTAFNPREGVDAVWAGTGAIYSQRLSALRTKSRLSAIAHSPHYKSMTIRNWNTTVKLLGLANEVADPQPS